MEHHRARIEADHNAGIPRAEWEPMEAIIKGALELNPPLVVARAYAVPLADMAAFVRPAKMRASVRRPSRSAVAMRVRRGMDMATALASPPCDKHDRAQRAAVARWENFYNRRGW